jgi:hypothetical protein
MKSVKSGSANTYLVQPQLRLPPWERRLFTGEVRTDFSNVNQAAVACLNDWPDLEDLNYAESTCTQLKWASLCGSNFNNYMTMWSKEAMKANPQYRALGLQDRRPIFASLNDNITVTTAWMELRDTKSDSMAAGRTGMKGICSWLCFAINNRVV